LYSARDVVNSKQKKIPNLDLTSDIHKASISARTATRSPAMGGRKTIMSLPNRLESTVKRSQEDATDTA